MITIPIIPVKIHTMFSDLGISPKIAKAIIVAHMDYVPMITLATPRGMYLTPWNIPNWANPAPKLLRKHKRASNLVTSKTFTYLYTVTKYVRGVISTNQISIMS